MKTLLCCIARLENNYIREWVEYNKNIGFTNICICDNNRDGEEYFNDVLYDYIDSGFVIIKDYRNKLDCQIDAYTDCYAEYGGKYDWIAFFDCDEFITLKEHSNITQYLSEERFNEFCVIRLNWMMYGDNDMLYNDGRPVLERFKQPLPINKCTNRNAIENEQFKSIIRGGQKITQYGGSDGFYFISPHSVNLIPFCDNVGHKLKDLNYRLPPNHEWAYLKHFCTKTAREYCDKIKRGYTDPNARCFIGFEVNLIENVFFVTNKITPAKVQIFKETLGIDVSYLLNKQ